MAEALKLGYCGVCDINQIWVRVNGRMVLTENYAEFSFILSDEMVYRHAICKSCIVNLTDEKVKALIERIKVNWAQEMVGWATDNNFDRMRSLELENYHQDEKVALSDHKILKEEKHQEFLKESKKQKDIADNIKNK
jgi:hypothetical protein